MLRERCASASSHDLVAVSGSACSVSLLQVGGIVWCTGFKVARVY